MTDILGMIRKNREARGWTEDQLAERSGLPQSTISSWYQKGMTPSFSSLEKKLRTFLTMSLRSYHVPEDEIKKAVDFIGGMDIRAVSERVMHELFKALAMRFEFTL